MTMKKKKEPSQIEVITFLRAVVLSHFPRIYRIVIVSFLWMMEKKTAVVRRYFSTHRQKLIVRLTYNTPNKLPGNIELIWLSLFNTTIIKSATHLLYKTNQSNVSFTMAKEESSTTRIELKLLSAVTLFCSTIKEYRIWWPCNITYTPRNGRVTLDNGCLFFESFQWCKLIYALQFK